MPPDLVRSTTFANNSQDCPFCSIDAARIFYADDLVIGLWDLYPVSPGHALLIPKRHVSGWFEATPDEHRALVEALGVARERIREEHSPDGLNVGINLGRAAGQTVFHLHVHVIPRYEEDVPDPRGGVRWVIPDKANYLATGGAVPETGAGPGDGEAVQPSGALGLGAAPHQRALIPGQDDSLLPHLLAHLDHSRRVDIAVAFVLHSGVDAIRPRLQEVLERGGDVRFLTGDYLGGTDPDALRRLLDLRETVAGGGDLDLRVFEADETPFHPKVYILRDEGAGEGIAFVGSSNLTRTGLTAGVEWNYRVVSSRERAGFEQILDGFAALFSHPETTELTEDWIDRYRLRRPELRRAAAAGTVRRPTSGREPYEGGESEPAAVVSDETGEVVEPHDVQQEALLALQRTREAGYQAGLVVMATGLGKTWLSAFDSVGRGSERVLFIAHREEILSQALDTYRKIAPEAHLGRYTGAEKAPTADAVFASIQTLSRDPNLTRFEPDDFDYIVMDEFHHACAPTYRKVLDHFEPGFLLGLTATPERTDGGDLLALCQENLVYRCDLVDGIRRGLLCPFRYWGVPDEIDYERIPWRGSRFDEEELTRKAATQARAENALEQFREHGQSRALGFCVSIRHAEFMADHFRDSGVSAVAVHSGEGSAPRTSSLERLAAGELDIVFAIDIFNEGVDVPDVDTVLMLRPTESPVIWLQQFGRGLRVAEGKDHLAAIDYIGNHRSFLLKPQALLGLGSSDREIWLALRRLEEGELALPPGCEVTYELETKEILRSLLRHPSGEAEILDLCENFLERYGKRPTALEALHEGHDPRSVRKTAGSWFGFLESREYLTEGESAVLTEHGEFLKQLEGTPITKSYKMLTLLAMLARDAFPGAIEIDELVRGFRKAARRSATLRADVSASLEDDGALRSLVEKNPVEAWVGGRGTGGEAYFSYEGGVFSTEFGVEEEHRETLVEMTREIVDWRLGEYMQRSSVAGEEPVSFVCDVGHEGGQGVLELPDRRVVAGIPFGDVDVVIDGEVYEASFGNEVVDAVRRDGEPENRLDGLLEAWFGPDWVEADRTLRVRVEASEDGYRLEGLVPGDSSE